MKLTRTERWMLANQFKILEKVDPESADYYQECQDIVQKGYEMEYSWISQHVYDEKDCLSVDECGELYDILSMHSDLKYSYEALADKSGIDPSDLKFWGFDGNNETKWLGYCRHVCDGHEKKFGELERADNFNSHMPTLDMYRRMLKVWQPISPGKRGISQGLSADQITEIIKARPHPSSPLGKFAKNEPKGPVQ
jgi:uncharacterized protein YfbU (UPF0304 family)